ncbi:hypothetical protein ABFV70_06820 [Staphylococcus arlettae]|nr:hypothetical protein [Staphylococcus saprophyticus]MDW3933514.1 hypothetical protein [Staphylococcus saprophyticus]MDW4049757.1 hypothetical protein [Staphylococcus saprophyticus]WFR69530.1 hypothetical protein QA542_11300 [Staphylococcus saprophyticus]
MGSKRNIEDLIERLNKDIDQNLKSSRSLEEQIKKNEKNPKEDNLQDISTHKEMINYQINKDLEFKRKARIWSIIVFLFISLIIVINLILILYWNPTKLDYKVIISLITVTFANLFTIITVIFKYVFSPTKDMLDYNANIYNKDE